MEEFDQCIFYNKEAKKHCEFDSLRQSNIYSDIGLAQYRLAVQGIDRNRELAFKSCRKALELNPENTNAIVNLGLIYKLSDNFGPNSESEAAKLFKAAVDKDNDKYKYEVQKRNPAALVNLGVIQYEFGKYEEAAILFLDALAIKPDDQEALCNLGLSLKHTAYKEYAEIALSEAVNVSPGNTWSLMNYMMLLLE